MSVKQMAAQIKLAEMLKASETETYPVKMEKIQARTMGGLQETTNMNNSKREK